MRGEAAVRRKRISRRFDKPEVVEMFDLLGKPEVLEMLRLLGKPGFGGL